MGEKVRLLIADGLADEGRSRLASLPSLQIQDGSAMGREEILKAVAETDVLIVRSRTQVDPQLLGTGQRLKLVIRAGIGLDNVDVKAATDRGIVVMNAPQGNIVTTAEHAIALMFSVSRHVPQADASLRKGKWDKKKFQGNQLCGKTLGVVGLGNIGKIVAKRGLALEMTVLGFDPYVSEDSASRQGIKLVGLDELLTTSDYVSIHVPLTEATKHLINADAIRKMKKSAYLINCARGGIIDETALLEALDGSRLAGAALDVFETEPLPADSPLLKSDKVVLTPHLGASTDEAQLQVSIEVADQLISYLRDGIIQNAINVPNLSREQVSQMRPYLTLCERLGGFLGQVSPQGVKRIQIRYEGAISGTYNEALTLSTLKGYLTPLLSTGVNFVNARNLCKERGIRVEESFDEVCQSYASTVSVTVEGSGTLSCTGAIFGKEEPRIVRIDSMPIDALPEGCMLFTRNVDQPGVIGLMGTTLGTDGVNISRMALGLDKQKGQAIALINVDTAVPAETVEKLRKSKGMLSVHKVQL